MKIQNLLLSTLLIAATMSSCSEKEDEKTVAFDLSYSVAPSYGVDNDKAAQNVMSYYKNLLGSKCTAEIVESRCANGISQYDMKLEVPEKNAEELNTKFVATFDDRDKLSALNPSNKWLASYSIMGTSDSWKVYLTFDNPSIGKYTATIDDNTYELDIIELDGGFTHNTRSFQGQYKFTLKCNGKSVWSEDNNLLDGHAVIDGSTDKSSANFSMSYTNTKDIANMNGAMFDYYEDKNGSEMSIRTFLINGVNVLENCKNKVKMTRM